MQRGFFAVGIYMPKTDSNVGTLLRSAFQMGASFTFTIGRPTKIRAASNTVKSYRHMPHFIYETFEDFQAHRPYGAPLVGIEMGGVPLHEAKHPESAIYLLGREDTDNPIASEDLERLEDKILRDIKEYLEDRIGEMVAIGFFALLSIIEVHAKSFFRSVCKINQNFFFRG